MRKYLYHQIFGNNIFLNYPKMYNLILFYFHGNLYEFHENCVTGSARALQKYTRTNPLVGPPGNPGFQANGPPPCQQLKNLHQNQLGPSA